jgi:ribonuclease P protein component
LLSSKYRLRKSQEIKTALKKRQYEIKHPLLQIVAKDNNCKNPRVAVVVKGINSAIKRNRIKRLFREAMRKNIDKIGKNIDMVIFPKQAAIKEKSHKITKNIEMALKKWQE